MHNTSSSTNNKVMPLDASFNLSNFKRLCLDEARPTTVTLQLTDRSFKHPREVIEDVHVKETALFYAKRTTYFKSLRGASHF